jgi:hypothetical protein
VPGRSIAGQPVIASASVMAFDPLEPYGPIVESSMRMVT